MTDYSMVGIIGFQYSKSTDSCLYFDMKIIWFGLWTPEIQPFKKDHFFTISEKNTGQHEWYTHKITDYAMIENDNHTQLYISKIDRFLTFFWYEDHSDRSTYTWVTIVWKWQYFAALVKMNNNVNCTLTKWLITPWWK